MTQLVRVLMCAAGTLWAQDPFLRWLDEKAQRQLDERGRVLAGVRTREAAERRRAAVREKILKSIGGLPAWNGPLNARVTGRVAADGYTIEKVIFVSLPGFYVTGNVYRPNGAGKYPGVLVPAGHTQEGKPEPQWIAANLARKGFVALTYDPIGQGEREQTYLPQLGRALSGGGGNEHLELGARSLLIGQSVARYFIHDAKRAVDYLVSRPDVDAGRLGVTGCSGGGAIGTYVGMFDPRIKAAAVGCFLSTFRTLFTGPTPDSEMTLPRFLANGLDTADLFAMAAPLPWLLMATTEDYFTPDSARPVYEEARRFYALYGAEEKIRFAVGPGPHGTPKESREEIYRWMIRWLKGGQGDWKDEPVKLLTSRELRVTASGNVDGEPGSRKLYQVIQDEYRALRRPQGRAELRAELERVEAGRSGGTPEAIVLETEQEQGYRVEVVRFASEPGVMVQGRLYLPAGAGKKPAVLMVAEKRLPVPLYVQRSQSTAALAEQMARAGQVVLELDVRDSPAAHEGRPFLGNWVTNERAEVIGLNLPVMRARDIQAGVALLAARAEVNASAIRGYARGAKGFWMLLAAAVEPRLKRIWLDRTPYSFAMALERPLASFLFDALIPGFALHWDVPDLVALIGRERVYWTDPSNWMSQVEAAGPEYRYRHVGESDAALLKEFL